MPTGTTIPSHTTVGDDYPLRKDWTQPPAASADQYKLGDRVWYHELEWCPAVITEVDGDGFTVRALVRRGRQLTVVSWGCNTRRLYPGRVGTAPAVDHLAGRCTWCVEPIFSDMRDAAGSVRCPSVNARTHMLDARSGPHNIDDPEVTEMIREDPGKAT